MNHSVKTASITLFFISTLFSGNIEKDLQTQFILADPGAIGVKLQLQNELAGNQPAVMYLDGKLDTQDNLSIFGQLTVDMDQTAVLRASWGLAKSFLGHDATAEGGRD